VNGNTFSFPAVFHSLTAAFSGGKKNRQLLPIPGLSARFHPQYLKHGLSDAQNCHLFPIASAIGAPNSLKPVERREEYHTICILLSECTVTYSEHNGTEHAAYRASVSQVTAVTNLQKASIPHRSVLRIFPTFFLPHFQRKNYIIKN
jgi:hypothetical protein